MFRCFVNPTPDILLPLLWYSRKDLCKKSGMAGRKLPQNRLLYSPTCSVGSGGQTEIKQLPGFLARPVVLPGIAWFFHGLTLITTDIANQTINHSIKYYYSSHIC